MRILLLSAYDAASHRVWREGLVRNLSDHDWTVLALPPRFFAWRSRGNPISWAFGEREVLEKDWDLLVATSMTDLAGLKGIVPSLAGVPSVVYFHENQFAYPEQRARREYQNYKLTNLYTALAADRVLFNSKYNMETFMEGAAGLLSLMPDHVPAGVIEAVRARSKVLPVPLEEVCFTRGPRSPEGPVSILWNHRWEHDKAPRRLFEALYSLCDRHAAFDLYFLGQRFRDLPPGVEGARERLGDKVRWWGYVEDEQKYRGILASADVVVSTALHDFQGLAVLEAVAAGCLPLVPDRLAYREFIPESYRYASFADDERREVDVLARRLETLCRDPKNTRKMEPPDLNHLKWANLGPGYGAVISGVSASRAGSR